MAAHQNSRQEHPLAQSRADTVIDLVHLARQTAGDVALERELLALFARQANTILDKLSVSDPALSRQTRADLAHTLRGSALAVGAGNVATAAAVYEQALRIEHGLAERAVPLEDLEEAVQRANCAVLHLLAA